MPTPKFNQLLHKLEVDIPEFRQAQEKVYSTPSLAATVTPRPATQETLPATEEESE
jgi:hypothetical protein